MADRPTSYTDAEFDRLLRDCGEHLAYPSTPDVSAAVRTRLFESSEAARDWARPHAGAWDEPAPPLSGERASPPVDGIAPFPGSGGRSRLSQGARLVAAILVFAAVSAVLVAVFRGFGGSDAPTTAGGNMGDVMDLSYIGLRDESLRLYAVDIESDDERDLTDDALSVERAAWSPDGERLAVSQFINANGGQRWQIFLMNADGSDRRPLTDLPGEQLSPVWSPDGRKIAFVYADPANNSVFDVYVAQVDGSGIKNVPDSPLSISNPVWSPDSQRLAVSTDVPAELQGNDDSPAPGISVVNADGSGFIQVAAGFFNRGAKHVPLAWTPDGRQVVYLESSVSGTFVFLAGAVDDSRAFVIEDVSSPAVSPDGRHIAFSRFGGIWVADLLETDIRAAQPPDAELWTEHQGAWIATPPGIDVRGSNRRSIAENGHSPVWSPDGEWIAFVSDEGAGPEVAIVRPDGSDRQRVTDHDDPLDAIINLAWRPHKSTPVVEPVASPTPPPVEKTETLFAVDFDGTITAMDAGTMEPRYTVQTSGNADAVVSPDGRRLYAAGLTELFAFDAATGEEVWRAPVENRTQWILGIGPSVLTVSPDGERLYVYSHTGQYSHWLQIFDAGTGEKLGDTDAVEVQCPAPPAISESGETAYLPCQRSALVNAFDLTAPPGAQHFTVSAPVPTGSAQSADGQRLYLVSQSGLLTIIEGDARNVSEPVDLLEEDLTIPRGLVALSLDERYLFVGIRTEMPDSGREVSGEIRVYDTETLEEIARLTREPAMTGWTLAGGEGAVFGVEHRYVEGTGIPAASEIVRLSVDGEVETRVLAGQEIMRLLVSSMPVEE